MCVGYLTVLGAGLVLSMCHGMNKSCKSQPYCFTVYNFIFTGIVCCILELCGDDFECICFFNDLILTVTIIVFCAWNVKDIVFFCRKHLITKKYYSESNKKNKNK